MRKGASFRMRSFSFSQLSLDSNDPWMSHRLSEAFKSLNARGWFPIALKTGGINRYQPASASTVAWRGFILLFLEARIVPGNTCRVVRDCVIRQHRRRAPGFGVSLDRVLRVADDFMPSPFAGARGVKALNNLPIAERSTRDPFNRIGEFRAVGRHHQIPAHKREGGGVAGVHCVDDLASRRATGKLARPEGFEPPTLRSEV